MDDSNAPFQFRGTGQLTETSMIFFQMNRVNEAFSRPLKSLRDDETRVHLWTIEQTIRVLEDNVYSFLDDEYRERKKEVEVKLRSSKSIEGDIEERVKCLHDMYQIIVDVLNRQNLWFKTHRAYEIARVIEDEEDDSTALGEGEGEEEELDGD